MLLYELSHTVYSDTSTHISTTTPHLSPVYSRPIVLSSTITDSIYNCLPYDVCALSLNILSPSAPLLCSSTGLLFDADILLPYLRQHKLDPISGLPYPSVQEERRKAAAAAAISGTEFFPVRPHRNSDGRPYCPITEKVLHAK
eukprot:GHVQ01014181.1.p1 GENE.GHVQ01014181.1~~GHVQ01014181.1.p1  ORF type:complete len:143 (-),score=30.19 GHVQ01014181.1:265-693(-)